MCALHAGCHSSTRSTLAHSVESLSGNSWRSVPSVSGPWTNRRAEQRLLKKSHIQSPLRRRRSSGQELDNQQLNHRLQFKEHLFPSLLRNNRPPAHPPQRQPARHRELFTGETLQSLLMKDLELARIPNRPPVKPCRWLKGKIRPNHRSVSWPPRSLEGRRDIVAPLMNNVKN